jgi:regulatory protein
MRITALQPHARNPERVHVHVDGQPRLTLSAELVLTLGVRLGDEVDEARLEELERRDQPWRAREAALSLLSYRPRSAAELRRRVARKGFDAEVVDACVETLGNVGVVDDAAFAETFVRDRVRLRPQGASRLRQELRARGVDAETASAAIGEVMEVEDASEVDLARAAAARWKPRPGEERDRARRRLHGFLARRGFGGDAVRTVLAEKLDSNPG